MNRKYKLIIFFLILVNFFNISLAKENFFEEAKKKFEDKNIEDSKFLFQRNIVFNPKHAKSYLYLAKIYNFQENQEEEEKNLNTTLLLEPDNEEAMYMLIKIELKRSNYSKVKKLRDDFKMICSNLCEKTKSINDTLQNIEPKNAS
jgi:tetratricopeptide (TPR) repeat protein